jgi:hypothetical protein
MSGWLEFILEVCGYFVFLGWILPRLGVPT